MFWGWSVLAQFVINKIRLGEKKYGILEVNEALIWHYLKNEILI